MSAVFYYVSQTRPKTTAPDFQALVVGYIRLTSKPTGATIKVDGKLWSEVTPTLVQSPVGTIRKITIEDPDHEPRTYEISADKDGQTKLHAVLVRKKGQLEIVTKPAGATILMEGQKWGSTPLVKEELFRKIYQISLEKEGYQPKKITVDLRDQSEDIIVVNLLKIVSYGTLDVSSRPWAQVFIDGKQVAESTPAYGLKVLTGEHTVRFVNPRLNKFAEEKILITKDETQSLVVDLK